MGMFLNWVTQATAHQTSNFVFWEIEAQDLCQSDSVWGKKALLIRGEIEGKKEKRGERNNILQY